MSRVLSDVHCVSGAFLVAPHAYTSFEANITETPVGGPTAVIIAFSPKDHLIQQQDCTS